MMTAINQKIRRLPGFRFETGTLMREDVLPRMDVALFVGFSSKGPVNIPVALESIKQFEEIFGDDLPLVWDKEKGAMIYAYLAPSVRMFFRNGGRRCWIIRTARVEAEAETPDNFAAYNFFPLTNLAEIRFDAQKISEKIVPAFARSSSKGSWSDNLRISTAFLSTSFKFKNLTGSGGKKILQIEASPNQRVKTGDLLKLDFPDSDLSLILIAGKIENDSENEYSASGKLKLNIAAERFVWLQNLPEKNFPKPQNVTVNFWTRQNNPAENDFAGSALNTLEAELGFERDDSGSKFESSTKISLKFSGMSAADAPEKGSLLVTKFQNELLCLQVENVLNAKIGELEKIQLVCKGVFVRKTATKPISKPDVEKLAFDIWIKDGEKTLRKLNDLAFDPSHERFWGNLQTDDELYNFEKNQNPPENPSRTFDEEFAASPIAGNGEKRDGFSLPIFPVVLAENYLGAIKLNGTKLQRDGLQVFDESLFLDEKLKTSRANILLDNAENIRYLSAKPRRLWGIHSALTPETVTVTAKSALPDKQTYASFSLDEATIVCVPDALHRGWFRDDETGSVSPMPKPFDPPVRPEWWRFQDCRNRKPEPVEKPLWENFLDCGLKIVAPPENLRVEDSEVSDGAFTLAWDYEKEDKNPVFVLEESATPEFEFPEKIYRDKDRSFEISSHGAGIFYYRVRAEAEGAVSNWSNGLKIKIPAAENWTAKFTEKNESSNPEKYFSTDVLLAVQRSLLRICAARGDIFAVLDLPEHFEKDEATRYVSTLRSMKNDGKAMSKVEPFSSDEKNVLSFGAIYHSWFLLREETYEEIRNVPPSGAICGTFAKRSSERGAWIAPANQALQNVLGLTKEFGRAAYLDFQDALINLVRREPNGFLVLDSDTLSDDFDLRQINVRRLMSLLRRLALKHGAEYVFEPNNERFRRNVQRGFKNLLDKMFVRGAFAGATPAASYQVVVSDTINNFQSVEQGRFIVELRVAPSLPLKFVTVRLINSGGRNSISESV